MTTDELARSYFSRARKRRVALQALFGEEAYADVIRESQELVELVLKGMLRAVGVDPPKWHDVGGLLLEQQEAFPPVLHPQLAALADISARLRKEREFSFYGDIDFIPDEHYDREDALGVMEDVDRVLACLSLFESGMSG